MAAHRYWRLRQHHNGVVASGTTYTTTFQMGMSELEWRDTPSGSNVLSGGTISTSSDYDPSYTAGDLIDGSTGTSNEWVSAGQATRQWVKYDFGSGNDKDIVEVVISARPWYNGVEPGLFIMESSDDDSSWTPEWYGFTSTAWAAGNVRTFTNPGDIDLTGGHRYWRIYITASDGALTPSFGDIYLRTGSTTTDLAPLATVAASSAFNDDHQPENAVDLVAEGGAGGDWGASSASVPQWVSFDFGPGSAPDIQHVTLKARTSFFTVVGTPTEGTWEYSDDGSSWTPAFSFNEAAWSNGEIRELTQLSSIIPGAGASAGTGAATGVWAGTAPGAGSAAGTGSATAGTLVEAAGSALGTGSAAANSTLFPTGVGLATGAGVALAYMSVVESAVGDAAGTGVALGVGTNANYIVGTAAGTGEALGSGAVLGFGIGSSDASGTSSAAASSSTYFSTAGYSESIAHVYGVGTGIIPAEGAVATLGAATGVGAPLTSGVGASAGTGAAAGTSAGLEDGAGASAGTSDAVGVGGWDLASLGLATSTGAAAAVGSQVQAAVGAAAGTGAATGVGEGTPEGVGASAGTGAATAIGRVIASGAGAADGTSTVSGVMTAVQLAAAVSAAVGAAMAVGSFTAISPLVSTRTINVRGDIRAQSLLPDDEWATPLA